MIHTYVKQQLEGNTGLTALIEDRLFAVAPVTECEVPFVTYKVSNTNPRTMAGVFDYSVEIEAWANTHADAVLVISEVNEVFGSIATHENYTDIDSVHGFGISKTYGITLNSSGI